MNKNHKTRDWMLKLSIVPIDGMHSREICRDVDRVAWEVYWVKMSVSSVPSNQWVFWPLITKEPSLKVTQLRWFITDLPS